MAPLVLIFLAMVMGICHNCTATEWIVYPVSSTNVTKLSRTTSSLTLILGKRNAQAYRSAIRKTTEFWLVQANNAQKAQISQLPFVRTSHTRLQFLNSSRHMQVKAVYENSIVVENCGRTYGKDTGVVNATEPDVAPSNAPLRWQTDASPDLNIMSWPPRKRLLEKYRGYVYDVGAGVGTYIYVIDNGVHIQNPVRNETLLSAVQLLIRFQDFTKMPWPPTPAEWHYAPGVRHTQTDDSFDGHGTCVASKAAGWRSGVSKNSQLVIMKASLTVADQHWAFAAALDDILAKGRQKRAVIVYPRTSTQAADDAYRGGHLYMWSAIQNLIDELNRDAGILVVVPAGNFATRSKRIDTFPGIWADSKPVSQGLGLTAGNIKPLLAVGAVTLTGAQAPFSQGVKESQLRWAPGEQVTCAGGYLSPEQVYADGTSFAASMVLFSFSKHEDIFWLITQRLLDSLRTL